MSETKTTKDDDGADGDVRVRDVRVRRGLR